MILPSACRSAEQDTAIATGQDAPCRGSRITRTSWQKYLPPNCAPMPICRVMLEHLLLELEVAEPVPGHRARRSAACPGTCADAYFAVFSANSAAGPADHDGQVVRRAGRRCPRERIFSSRNVSIRLGFSTALVSWYRNDLLAEPPPLAMNRNLYASPSVA